MSRDEENPSCGNCRFWEELQDGDGQCRRHAPRPVPEMAVTHPKTENFNPRFVFPVTAIVDWCGELELIENE